MISGVRKLVNPRIDKLEKNKRYLRRFKGQQQKEQQTEFMPVAMPYRNKGRPSLSHGLDKEVIIIC